MGWLRNDNGVDGTAHPGQPGRSLRGHPAERLYNVPVADDPIDAFDKFADDIRRTQDELDAADKLRSDKAADQKRKTEDPAAGPGAPDGEPPKGG
jgi:hypothetical protein